jgi:hypothetical protein
MPRTGPILCSASIVSVQWRSSIGSIVQVDTADSLPAYFRSTT